MHQAPTPLWNEIAATQELRTPLWARLFKLPQDKLTPALEALEAKLEAQGLDARTTRAFLLVAPLLQENVAISNWIEANDRPDLRNSMPELVSINEALTLAATEFRLMPSQTKKLRQLLSAEPSTLES